MVPRVENATRRHGLPEAAPLGGYPWRRPRGLHAACRAEEGAGGGGHAGPAAAAAEQAGR